MIHTEAEIHSYPKNAKQKYAKIQNKHYSTKMETAIIRQRSLCIYKKVIKIVYLSSSLTR